MTEEYNEANKEVDQSAKNLDTGASQRIRRWSPWGYPWSWGHPWGYGYPHGWAFGWGGCCDYAPWFKAKI
ncbi:unnamed protein product [Strongylus vulgaris]|uniref:Uncharacterized protein n=1 Tax=Strongylus vulgaris TaxID=40348 RepID=A0A3P7JH35_STRVU|nr:unnamed protein product [Strongylus vulgaris]